MPHVEPFKQFAREFRDAHAEYGQTLFALELLMKSEVGKFYIDGLLDNVFGFIPWGYGAADGYNVLPIIGGDPPSKSWEVFYDRAKAAWECFLPLATAAGAHIPMAIRTALPSEPAGGLSVWYGLLLAVFPKCGDDLICTPEIRRLLSCSPFLDSADAIELCGLTTDRPLLAVFDGDRRASAPPVTKKRSTVKGEATIKLIAALTKHHGYADGSCLNLEHIGNNELARLVHVSDSTASAFFKKEFGGHLKYRSICTDATSLVTSIKVLNQEFSPFQLFGASPPGEDKCDDE